MHLNRKLWILGGVAATILPAVVTSCDLKIKEDKNIKVDRKKTLLFNLSNVYNIDENFVDLYFINNGNVPYVSVVDAFYKFGGFFDTSNFSISKNLFSSEIKFLPLSDNFYSTPFYIDTNKNTLSFRDYYFYNFVKPNNITNYSRHLKVVSSSLENRSLKKTTINFNEYGIDIYKKDGKILMPLVVFNTLFFSQNYFNLYYNGEALIATDYALIDGMNNLETIRKSKWNDTKAPKDIREMTYKHINFIMDNFYGLRVKNKYRNFSKWINDSRKKDLLSDNQYFFNRNYAEFFHRNLDELHTRVSMPSFFNKANDTIVKIDAYKNNMGLFRERYIETYQKLEQQRKAKSYQNEGIRYKGDTAIITFNQFKTAPNKQETANNDSYQFFKIAMKEIEQKNIKNIVIDLSLNGGGNIGAMLRVLGFITDRQIPLIGHELLTNQIVRENYKIDTDGDRRYDRDAYTQYNWNLLVGINTFSAANLFTSIFNDLKLGKIIGQKTGGGMCSVLPIVLADGTTVEISSNNCSINLDLNEIESGVKVDEILNYDDFYDDDKLINAIKGK